MKTGILSFPNSTSYGAVLQMYALYQAVEAMGVDCEIINYMNTYMAKQLHTSAKQTRLFAKNFCKNLLHCRLKAGFQKFEKTMKMYPAKSIHDADGLETVGMRYDAIICGSDQVWNPDITGNDLSYFLNFCMPKTKRISYAPSFGRKDLPEEFQRKIQNELEQFKSLSVREREGQEMLAQILNRHVPLVLDPSFLLTKEDWTKLEKKHPAACEPYILYYTVRSSQKLLHFCMNLAEMKNMKVVLVGGNVIRSISNRNKKIEYAWDIDPREWLYLLHHADCVVTNSFHGTAFSINYQKDFYVEFSSLTNSRLEHIIRTMDLYSRVVQEGCALSEEHIDYHDVEMIVSRLRKESIEYLREAVVSE